MATKITRLVHGTTLYELGKPWPGAELKPEGDLSQLTVGPIFFRPETMEDVVVKGLAGDPVQGIEPVEPTTFTETTPAQYEVWCVTHHVFVAFFGRMASTLLGGSFEVDKEKLASAMENLIVTRRCLPAVKIEFVDDEMSADDAVDQITLRLVELEGGDDNDDDDDGDEAEAPEASAPAPDGFPLETTGNGGQQATQS